MPPVAVAHHKLPRAEQIFHPGDAAHLPSARPPSAGSAAGQTEGNRPCSKSAESEPYGLRSDRRHSCCLVALPPVPLGFEDPNRPVATNLEQQQAPVAARQPNRTILLDGLLI